MLPNNELLLWIILTSLAAIWPTSSGDWSHWVCLFAGMRLGWVTLDWIAAGLHSLVGRWTSR